MYTFTVFTPTYNRAYIIHQLYDSLKAQSVKNFDWLIIDDGSTDDTEEIITSFINEDVIPITYIKQENQGKHIAINTSLQYIKGDYIITIDSDDYLLPQAIHNCNTIIKEINSSPMVAGFTFFNYLGKENLDYNLFGKIKSYDHNLIKFNIKGENSFVLRSDFAKQFKFPVFQNEKFCQEAYILVQIRDKYKILFTDFILARGEYLEDGLSQNIYKRLLNNPRYALETLKVKYNSSIFNSREKENFAINFWDITLKTKVINPFVQLFNFPLKGTLIYLKYRFKKRS